MQFRVGQHWLLIRPHRRSSWCCRRSLPVPPATVTRPLALLEEMSMYFADAPAETLLGTVDGNPNLAPGVWTKRMWSEDVTENPTVGATEVWSSIMPLADAHPMHIHEVLFQVVDRQAIFVDEATRQVQVEPWIRADTARALGKRLQKTL